MSLLEREGVDWEYCAFEDAGLHDVIYTRGNYGRKAWHMLRAVARRVRDLRDLRRYDLVFIYEEAARIGPAVLERLVARRGVPIVYDFCDPIYLPYESPTNRHLSYLKFFGKTKTICRLARHVIVGNPLLADWAAPYSRALSVVPITIDTDSYRPRERRPPEPGEIPTIGWSGSHTTVPHLDGLRAPLQELSRRRKFRLRVLGVRQYQLPGVEVDARPWNPRTEVQDLQTFDIGMMPLPSDPWTVRRTHLKVRQYMGLAIPAIASPVGVNTELLRDGTNGLLAASDAEWVEKLTLLLNDYELRRTLGDAGRRTIEQHYSARVWTPHVLAILEHAAQPISGTVGR
jgi:glycosyltransferase involved in cell wall biosynthesis